ncbi:hypothetical protein C8J57DRAFT_17611 [Mycena rebaudengoi]|nr:hypothetical protein C8J57DRAFT_17611 [Mycena rebaudengoi]
MLYSLYRMLPSPAVMLRLLVLFWFLGSSDRTLGNAAFSPKVMLDLQRWSRFCKSHAGSRCLRPRLIPSGSHTERKRWCRPRYTKLEKHLSISVSIGRLVAVFAK